MTNLFIQSLRTKHLKEQEQIKARRQTANRIIDTSSKGNSYNWGVIQELKKDVAPTVNAVSDNKTAHQEFLHTLEEYGLGGDGNLINSWKEVLGSRDTDPYYKRMLTIAVKETLNKFIAQIKSK
jgi:hypothetical protein|tara:strand:- start:247 stop:618 length:372 start_codon:yes stop_codon:yes gene_type:complete